jgi:signal transduction histidine kinase
MLGHTEREKENAFHVALYEGIIDVTLNGETRMIDSVLESAARHSVAVGRPLTHLLGVPQRLRERIWERIGQEIDPEPAFVMLVAVDNIFIHITRVTIETYLEATQLAEVSRANRELAGLEQAKTDFISIAAHELKTPLTLIHGYINILSDLISEERVTPLIEGIQRGAERMSTIIEDMLDLSALDTNQLRLFLDSVNLNALIELIVSQLKSVLLERQQTVELVNLAALPAIEADPQRLYQIFKQIISNAIKYTPDGGQITITGQELQAKVEDTGVGIAPEDREKIFEKFYRASDSSLHSTSQTKFMGAGPGLGLAIAKGLVEAHQGQISAESQGFDMQNYPGSALIVRLPIQAMPRPGLPINRIPEQSSRVAE